jgi:Tfp pilus assembly protein PilO
MSSRVFIYFLIMFMGLMGITTHIKRAYKAEAIAIKKELDELQQRQKKGSGAIARIYKLSQKKDNFKNVIKSALSEIPMDREPAFFKEELEREALARQLVFSRLETHKKETYFQYGAEYIDVDMEGNIVNVIRFIDFFEKNKMLYVPKSSLDIEKGACDRSDKNYPKVCVRFRGYFPYVSKMHRKRFDK